MKGKKYMYMVLNHSSGEGVICADKTTAARICGTSYDTLHRLLGNSSHVSYKKNTVFKCDYLKSQRGGKR